ncbi:MAG: ABC transporter ATP-binding protein [Actinomycetes bacterium]
MTPVLEVSGLVAGYGRTAVVHDLDLVVQRGEVVALLGPNGAGKTTTLLTVAGLLEPIAGSVAFGEGSGERRPHRLARAGVALVPDDRGLFDSLTVREHLQLGVPRRDRSAAVDRAVELFPVLEPITDRRVGLLSGGEQQMVALAVALDRSPSLLMIDELSLGLAPLVVRSLIPAIRTAAAATNCGVLLVEQHAHVALDLASRAYVMTRGRVCLEAPTSDLRADPTLLEQAYLG